MDASNGVERHLKNLPQKPGGFTLKLPLYSKRMAMDKAQKIAAFDVNGLAQNNNLFGLPFTQEESEVIFFPVPWEVTVSYTPGTASGPQAIRQASAQVDLYDPNRPDGWQAGFFMVDEDADLAALRRRT